MAKTKKTTAAGRGSLLDRTDIKNTYEGTILIEYNNSNPNGEINAGGAPAIDPVDGRCRATGESFRRKGRDYVWRHKGGHAPYDILVRGADGLEREDGGTLTIDDLIQRCRKNEGLGVSPLYLKELETKKKQKKKPSDALEPSDERKLREAVARVFWDVRTYGCLLSVGNDPIGGFKGPLAIQDGVSLHPVIDIHQANTRKIVTRESEKKNRNQTIGNRVVLRYALMSYRFCLTPAAAAVTGMSMVDFKLALEAMINCWADDTAHHRRGVFRGIWMFKQPAKGRRPVPHDWDEVVEISCKLDEPINASNLSDFGITVHEDRIPPGVEVLDTEAVLNLIGYYKEGAA